MRFCQILLIALLLLQAYTQSCANTQDSSLLLQTGRIQVINSNSAQASRLHSYSIPITYIVPLSGFQIAASISGLALTNQFKNSFDFTVRGGRGASASTAQVVVFITDDSTWTSVEVSYLISSRSDLFLGSFIADGYIFQSTSNNVLTLSFSIPNWVSTSSNVIAVTEFAGLRTFLPQALNISFVSTNVNAVSGLLRTVINTNTAFQLLYLTYYWWITGTSDLVYSNFKVNDETVLAYHFVGIDAINGNQIVYVGSGFNRAGIFACNGDRCPNSCVNTNTCINLKGVQSNVACFLCGPNQVYNNNNCVNAYVCGPRQSFNGSGCSCSSGFISVNGACLPSCGTNAFVNSSGLCQCISNTNCKQITTCQSNQILVGGSCICDQGFILVNGLCVSAFTCPVGTIWNSGSQSCVCANPSQYLLNGVCQSCIANSAWNGTRCNCNTGFQLINGICTNCPSNSVWNGNFCACIPNYYLINGVCSQCQANSAWNGTTCNCLSGFNLLNGNCIACPANSVWVASQQNCVCLSGFYLMNGVCISCPANSYWNGSSCVCLSGFLFNNSCIQCQANSVWNGTVCNCVTSYYLINGVCSQCPQNTVWNGNSCVCITNFYFINGVCSQCPTNTNWNGNACVCIANYFLINGVCSQCQSNSAWNGTACNCLSGFNLINGNCVSCPALSVWVAAQQACVCLSGYYLLNNTCIACPANSGWNGNACICLGGFVLVNTTCVQCPANTVSNGTACVCSSGFFNVSGNCQQAPPNSYYNGTAFVCSNFYILLNGVCTSCPANSVWNGVTCECNKGFNFANGECIKCPARSKWNGVACECNKGFNFVNGECIKCPARSKWNGVTCECNNKKQYLINNNCTQCPPNSAWGGQTCICLNGYYPNNGFCLSCGPNSFWNGVSCICSSGFSQSNGLCTSVPNVPTCGPNSAWNGATCACNSGFYLIGGTCQACPSNSTYNGSACVPNCQTKALWNGSSCVCQSGFFLIQNSCLPCDPNSAYDTSAQTCICKNGYFGNFQLCTQCDSSCQTCFQSGPKGCLSCPTGLTLNSGSCIVGCAPGQTLINGNCVTCPSSCLTCSDNTTCTKCTSNFNLTQQIVNGVSVVGCSLPGPSTPGSLLSLKGTVVGNNVIYQGLTLSTLPAYFLVTNCDNCLDLFIVTIMPNNLGVSYALSYVLNSQYWFLVEFNYNSKVNPTFQFKIQLNLKYANYFTSADMAQSVTGTISSTQYPSQPTKSDTSTTTNAGKNNPQKGGAQQTPMPALLDPTEIANSFAKGSSTTTVTPTASDITRSVSQAGTIKQIPSTTLSNIFA